MILTMKYLLLIYVTAISLSAGAQDEVFELVTDRPDQTESSAVVPRKSLQLETGFIRESDETTLYKQKSFAYNTTLLRYGFLENFELRMGIEYLGEESELISSDSSSSVSGLSPLYAGFKFKISEEEGWKPEIAFLGGMILPFTAGNDFKPQYPAANIRFAFSHTISERLSLGYNLGAEWDGESAIPGYFYSFALGLGVFDKLGMFLESYGLVREKGDAEHMLDAGFTYLLLPNLQLDISGGIGINEYATDNFISFGLSYRLPD